MTAVGEVRRDWNRPGYDVEPATEQTAPAGMTIVKALQQGHRAEVWLDGGTGPRACVGLVGIQLQGWWHTAGSAEQWAEAYNSACDHMRAASGVTVLVTSGQTAERPSCTVCRKPYMEHGTYPTCATHPYTPDSTCQHVGTLVGGVFTGAPCAGADCRNGCARAAGVPLLDGGKRDV